MSYTVIVEYWREDLQRTSMEVTKRATLRSAQYWARKSLKTAWLRPGYIPECARVEDSDENVVWRIDADCCPNYPNCKEG